MRILVVSDSHGDVRNLLETVRCNSSAEVVIHCGDGAQDVSEVAPLFPDKMFITVRGNCDVFSDVPFLENITLEGKKIFITHGNLFNVKSDLYQLSCAAREQNADMVLFGHTHIPTEIYDEGLYILNPGSLRGYGGSYALVDITDKGILTNIVKS